MREAGRILREEPLPHIDYIGFVEGDDIGKGKVDVVVTEGFAGNIALKTAEGTARQFADYLRGAISQSIWSKLGYLLARPAFRMLRDKMDPRKSTAASSSASTASSSRATAAPIRKASPPRSTWATTWCADELLDKIGETIRRHARRAPRRRAPIGGAAS